MGLLGDIWNGVMDLFGVGTSATQTKMNYDINQKNYDLALKNYEFQKDSYNKTFGLQKDNLQFQKDSYLNNFNYQKNLQQQLFSREDNAIQRRALDMEKAGLSKTLAAGDGAGAGSVVSTSPFTGNFNGSPFTGSSPVQSPVDLISAALSFGKAQAEIRKTNAETENLLKDGAKKDSEVLFTEAQTAYTKARTAVETKNYEMLDLTAEQIKTSNEKTRKDMALIDTQIKSLEQGMDIKDWEFKNLFPQDLLMKMEQVANLRRQGRHTDAQTIWQDIQSDIATQNLMIAEYTAKISAMDYEYQASTGMKPGANQNWIVNLITSFFNSETAEKIIKEIIPGWQSGSKPEHSEETKGKFRDNTPK